MYLATFPGVESFETSYTDYAGHVAETAYWHVLPLAMFANIKTMEKLPRCKTPVEDHQSWVEIFSNI
jgi:hypothetical protein